MFGGEHASCLHVEGKLVGAVRGEDRDALMETGDQAYLMRHKALSAATADAKSSGNASQIPSKNAAKKISSHRRHRDRKSPDLLKSLTGIASDLVVADTLSRRLRGQLHDILVSADSFSAAIYCEQTILVLDKAASLPGGLFADYTGGLCSPFTDESNNEQKLLHFFLCVPSYNHSAPLPIFELVTSDQTGTELYAALSAFKAAYLRVLRHPIDFSRITFDCAPQILSAFAAFCNGETADQYRERRWREARSHMGNAIGKTRMLRIVFS